MINCPSCEGYQRDIRQLQTELVAERAKLIVPGSMKCAKCSFGLMRVNLYVRNGTTGPGDNATEPCPNGCGPLWPETWEQAARDAWKTAEKTFDELAAMRANAEKMIRQTIEEVRRADHLRKGTFYKGPEPLSDDDIVHKVLSQ